MHDWTGSYDQIMDVYVVSIYYQAILLFIYFQANKPSSFFPFLYIQILQAIIKWYRTNLTCQVVLILSYSYRYDL